MRRFFLKSNKAVKSAGLRVVNQCLFVVVGIGVVFISRAFAQQNLMDINQLRTEVQNFAKAELTPLYPHLVVGDTMRIEAGNLDPRLQLRPCDGKLTMTMNTPTANASNISVKTRCTGTARWTIYVPVQVETFEEIVIAASAIGRGTQITDGDVVIQRMNTSRLTGGYLRDPARVVGLEAKRMLRPGEIIKLNQVKAPDVVKKGQTVVLEASSSALRVVTEATALANGGMGEQIKVRNNRSRRIVEAQVTGPGTARVAHW